MGRKTHPANKREAFKDANIAVPPDILPRVQSALAGWTQSPKVDYLREVYLSKFVSSETDPPITRRIRAMNIWLATEANNEATNDRLIITDPDYNILPGVRWERFCEWTRGFITRVIGETVPMEALYGSFSGGATTSRRRTEGHPALKFVGKADITESAREWFELVLNEAEPWQLTTGSPHGVQSLRTVRGSKFFTVPKNAVVDRVACKEPDINMFLQKGTGNYFRSRLRSFGINLNDQSRNQRLAQLGSLNGRLATLDLSSASDSISCGLVESFLPPFWYSYLNDIRSHEIEIDGEWHHCEMFSSMGNGFTFELESLLFFAFAKATAYFGGHKGVISVYGDDIIVPVTVAEDLIEVLDYLGFAVNPTKSFWSGPFRESCGGHYHDGVDITPFFIRGPIKTLVDLIHLLNQLRVWAGRGEHLFLSEEVWPLWSELSKLVPRMFWGGDVVTAGKYQLVSPGWPLKRLSQRTRPLMLPSGGQYLMSLLALQRRKETADADISEGVNSSEDSVALSTYRIRPARRWDWHSSGMEFLAEFTPTVI